MQMISFSGLGVFALVSLAVALRLLLLSARTRQLPEFLIGLSFLTGTPCPRRSAWASSWGGASCW
jgi:hypothetical protein